MSTQRATTPPPGPPAGSMPVAGLAKLSPWARQSLLDIGRPVSFAPGQTILEQGRRAESFYFVTAGLVKMCRPTPAGRTLILALFGPRDRFGVTPALSGEPATCSWKAVVATGCLEVRRIDLFALFARQPSLVPELLPWLTREMAECRNCLVETSCSRVETRFASLFAGLVERMGEPSAEGSLVRMPLTRQELADLTGTTIETAIRVMSRWSKDSLVSTTRDGFVVHDRPTLEALIQE